LISVYLTKAYYIWTIPTFNNASEKGLELTKHNKAATKKHIHRQRNQAFDFFLGCLDNKVLVRRISLITLAYDYTFMH
jgi:hypothetical protein